MKPIIDVARGSKMFWHEHTLACIYPNRQEYSHF